MEEINSNNNSIEDMLEVANKLYDQEKYERAIKVYSDLLLLTSDSDIYVKMGNCFDKISKSQTAIEYWEKAIEVDSMNSNAFINLGNYYFKKEKTEKAISYWIASRQAMPEEPISSLNLAIAYTQKNMPIEAFWYYEKYLKYSQDKTTEKYITVKNKVEKGKKLGDDYIKLGIHYQACNDNKAAQRCYEKAIQHCPIYSKAYLNLGSIFYAQKNYDEAAKYWEKAYYIDPNYPKTLSNLAVTYDILKKYDYAYCFYAIYSKFVIADPNEMENVKTRCHKIKPYLNSNKHLISSHLTSAEEAFSQCDYIRALCEYKNYIILDPEVQTKYSDLINKIEKYLHPEYSIIEACLNKSRKLLQINGNFIDAQKYLARVLVLANHDTPEYVEAKRKLGICIQRTS